MRNVAPNLQQDLVLATWTRSVALQDSASAAKLAPLLPNSLRESAGTGVGFSKAVNILRNPGREQLITTAAQYQRLQQLRYAAALLGQRRINDAKGPPGCARSTRGSRSDPRDALIGAKIRKGRRQSILQTAKPLLNH